MGRGRVPRRRDPIMGRIGNARLAAHGAGEAVPLNLDYVDSRKLGFLRVIQVLLAFNIAITLAVTVF